MATAARSVMQPAKKHRIRRPKQPPNLVVVHGGRELEREEGKALSLSASDRFRARQAERIQTRVSRLPDAPERRSVAHAMLMVEIRLVKAFWTIARQPLGSAMPLDARRNGIDYIHERQDSLARFVDAAGGKWDSIAPRPSLPSSKEIDSANEALDWLLLVPDEGLRKLLVVGATFKRGDAGRRINWMLVRDKLTEHRHTPVRTLKWRYREALRTIVSELTVARLG